MYCAAVSVAPALRMATLYVVDAPWLQIAKVEQTAEVEAGTVYMSVFVVAAGADCPRTLYVVVTA